MNNKVCLFIRVSLFKQDFKRQVSDLTAYCNERGWIVTKIIANKVTGTKCNKDRHDIEELLKAADKGMFGRVLVTEISRISRSSKGIRSVVDYLHERGISVYFRNLGMESLDESGKETFVMNIIIAILSEFSEREKVEQRERIISGLKQARLNGKIIGRPKVKEDKEKFLNKYKNVVGDLKRGLSLNEIMTLRTISKNTIIKTKKYLQK